MENQKEKVVYLSIINIMATVFVIMLHCNFPNIYNHESSIFPFGCFVEALCYCAVPLFFMISGATILDYSEKYSTKVFFNKRIKKVAIPFLFWSLVSVVYAFAISSPNKPSGLFEALIGIAGAKYLGPYWYMPCLMFLYLFYPFFSCFKGNKKIAAKRIVIISFFIIFIGFILSLVRGISFDKAYILYFFYVTLGYYLNKYEIPVIVKKVIYSLAIAGFGFLFFGTLLFSYRTGSYNTVFLSYLNIPCCLYSAGLFLLIKEWSYKNNVVLTKKLDTISTCSFGIYLTHWYFISILDKLLQVLGYDINSVMVFIIKVLCSFSLAFMLSWLFKKNKMLRIIIP